MQRPAKRVLQPFSIALIDILCSALGATLILLTLLLQRQGDLQEQRDAMAQEVQAAVEAIEELETLAEQQANAMDRVSASLSEERQNNAELAASLQDAEATADELSARAAQQSRSLSRILRTIALGNCTTDRDRVTATFVDGAADDGDTINVHLNDSVLRRSMRLSHVAQSVDVRLERGVNLLLIEAVNEGSSPPNTAQVRVSHCQNGRENSFEWQLSTNQRQVVYITSER